MSTAVHAPMPIVSTEPPHDPSVPHPDFVDVDKILTADGIVVIISQRRDTGRLTFGIFRRYMKNDQWRRTSFIPEVLAAAAADALVLAMKRMQDIRQRGSDAYPDLVMPVPPLD